MCIGVPLCVTDAALAGGRLAWCSGDDGTREQVDMALVDAQPAGTWVLVFRGAARQVLSEVEAARVRAARAALAAALAGVGDLDAFFADLVGREPELPAHLRAAPRGAMS
ncbi:MAG TPA: HypC/HybG/HupF family hydrogenase formation chaperone [Burkholderiaceae bacterium]|nr:HypC/HybG/HupF family hydrogenase formation chaperone [Burkholderiaceae bacterium]